MKAINKLPESDKIKIENIKATFKKERLIQEKFTLKSGKYGRDKEYYLVIADQDNDKKELHRYKFEIDISDMSCMA